MKETRTEIYYFSGTGNSLFVAKAIQNRIPNSVIIPIVSLLNNDVIKTDGKIIGIVFPVHALSIPIAVKHFMMKLEMQSAEYIFAVATRYGTSFRGFEILEKLLKRKDKKLNSKFIINMCHNEAPRSEKNYVVPSKDQIFQIEAEVISKVNQLSEIILNKGDYSKKDTEVIVKSSSNPIIGEMMERFIVFLLDNSERIGGVNYFYHDSNCNGCGVCEKVCLSEKIKIVENRPVWQKDVLCYMCFACLNYCPKEAVQIKDIHGVKSYTIENGRYPHPYATVDDIFKQKGEK